MKSLLSISIIFSIFIFAFIIYSTGAVLLLGKRIERIRFGFLNRLAGIKIRSTEISFHILPLWVRITITSGHSQLYGLLGHCIGIITVYVVSFVMYAVGHVPLQYPVVKPFLVVRELDEQSVLRTCGLQPGDTILSVNGEIATNEYMLSRMLKPGPGVDSVVIAVARNGRMDTVLVPVYSLHSDDTFLRRIDLVCWKKIVVASTRLTSETAGLRRGDTIITVNEKPCISREMLAGIVRSADSGGVRLSVKRQETRIDVTVKAVFDTSIGSRIIGIRIDEQYPADTIKTAGARDAFVNAYAFIRGISIFLKGNTQPVIRNIFIGPIGVSLAPVSIKVLLFLYLRVVTAELLLCGECFFSLSFTFAFFGMITGYWKYLSRNESV